MTQSWRPNLGYLAIALLLAIGVVSVALFVWMTSAPEAPASATAPVAVAPQRAPAPPVGAAPGAPSAVAARPAPEGDADPTPDLRSYVARGEKPTMAEVIERLHARGIHSGLGAFNPPGTKPPIVGLAVPENFELPKGYVRHHQVTDDGQDIEAVLMFAPDFQLYDADNKPVAMPRDRIVPPQLAPPGLPVRRIVIPPPRDSSIQDRQ